GGLELKAGTPSRLRRRRHYLARDEAEYHPPAGGLNRVKGRGLLPCPFDYDFTKRFQSVMPSGLRMSAEAGSSLGTRGALSSFKPASCGRRLPLRALTALSDHTKFSHASLPPRERGRMWSRLPSSGRRSL